MFFVSAGALHTMLKVLPSAFTEGRTFLWLKKLANSFEVKQKNLPLVMEAKKDTTTLKKTVSLIPYLVEGM